MGLSCKNKFILSSLIVEIFFLIIIVLFNFNTLNNLSKSKIDENIEASSVLFTKIIKIPVLTNDLATLDDAVSSFTKLKNIVAVKISNAKGAILSDLSDGNPFYRNIFYDNNKETNINNQIFRLKSLVIKRDNKIVANVKIIFEITDVLEAIQRNRDITLILVLLEVILSIFISYLVGSKLTKRIKLLTLSAQQIANNEEVILPKIDNNRDDISILTNALHIMQDSINNRSQELRSAIKDLKKHLKIIDENVLTSSTDLDGVITDVSRAFCEVSGYSAKELIGKTHSVVAHPDTPKKVHKELWKIITSGRVWYAEMKNRTKSGGFFWADSTIYPDYDYSGKLSGYYAIRHDITSKKRVEELSITDALTNLYNRRYFDEIFYKEINRAKRDKTIFCLLSLDVDYFKKYNDTYGHQEGDNVLSTIGKILKSNMKRSGDTAFRIGGEEFSAIFNEKNEKNIYNFTENIRKSIEDEKIVHKENSAFPFITVSIGVIYVDFSKNDNAITNKEILYKDADELLYKAKEDGRNMIVIKESNLKNSKKHRSNKNSHYSA